jgi:ribonuclease BN (tRNA processing enzyme)
MTTRITPLGNVGYIPTHGETTCFLVEMQEELIFIDSGTGIKKLNELKYSKIIEDHEQINFIFTHYHLDHVIGLSYWPKFFNKKKINIYAPQHPLIDFSFNTMIENLLAPPLFSLPFNKFPMQIKVIPFNNPRLSIGNIEILTLHQDHPGGSVTYRFNDEFVFATDTGVNNNTFTFAEGVSLLIHEVWFDENDSKIVKEQYPHVLKEHSIAPDLALSFQKSNIEKLSLTHMNPEYDENRLNNLYNYVKNECSEFIELKEDCTYKLS